MSEVGTYRHRPKADATIALLPDHGRLQCILTKLLAVGTIITLAFSTIWHHVGIMHVKKYNYKKDLPDMERIWHTRSLQLSQTFTSK